jgi:hypothetical protein
VSALFWFNVGIGSGLSLLVAAYAHCCVVLSGLHCRKSLWSLAFIFSALSCRHYHFLRQAMMFRQIAMIDIRANLFGSGRDRDGILGADTELLWSSRSAASIVGFGGSADGCRAC